MCGWRCFIAVATALCIVATFTVYVISDFQNGDALALQRSAHFQDVAQQFGIYVHQNIRIGLKGMLGRDVFTSSRIPGNTVLIKVPRACVLSEVEVRERSAFSAAIARSIASIGQLGRTEILAFALLELFSTGILANNTVAGEKLCEEILGAYGSDLREHLSSDRSFPQIWGRRSHPQISSSALSIEVEALAMLNYTRLGGAQGLLTRWRSETDSLFESLETNFGAEALARAGATRDLYEFARFGAASRTFSLHMPDQSISKTAAKGKRTRLMNQPGLVPLLDLCNNEIPPPSTPLLTWEDAETYVEGCFSTLLRPSQGASEIELLATQPLSADQSVLISYGLRSNAELLLHYGFTLPWIGRWTCFTRAPFVIRMQGLSDLVLKPSRCVHDDVELQLAIGVLRWQLSRDVELPKEVQTECSELKGTGREGWHQCHGSPAVAMELSAWRALAAIAGASETQHLRVAEHGGGPTRSQSHRNAVQILSDEAIVFRTIVTSAEQVSAQCDGVQLEALARCVDETLRLVQLAQWADLAEL